MTFIYCKECRELIYLTRHAFWNITDFGAICPKCETINTITLEKGELRKQSGLCRQSNSAVMQCDDTCRYPSTAYNIWS